ncbi:MAG: hypothetical protein HC880_00390 [Bacteroidia bacterium]|nr:hypothetical protein [Bacteroidia bacterium]
MAASGTLNTFVGFEAGKANTSGDGNVFLGMYTGLVNTTGSWNAFVGRDAGKANTSGRENAFLGVDAGASNSSGIQNTALGGNSLRTNSSGSYNVCVGFEAGRSTSTSSSSNVFLGYQAGYAETGSNKFYIDNANNTVPFMYGDFTAKALCINTKNYQEGSTVYKLSVGGKIRADEVKVYTGWADYVFADDYKLRPLKEVEAFIQQHKHLPEVPSAQEVEENGVLLGEMNATLLKKIEELTLYMIEMEKKAEKLEETVAVLQKNVAYLQQENAELKEKDHR